MGGDGSGGHGGLHGHGFQSDKGLGLPALMWPMTLSMYLTVAFLTPWHYHKAARNGVQRGVVSCWLFNAQVTTATPLQAMSTGGIDSGTPISNKCALIGCALTLRDCGCSSVHCPDYVMPTKCGKWPRSYAQCLLALSLMAIPATKKQTTRNGVCFAVPA